MEKTPHQHEGAASLVTFGASQLLRESHNAALHYAISLKTYAFY